MRFCFLLAHATLHVSQILCNKIAETRQQSVHQIEISQLVVGGWNSPPFRVSYQSVLDRDIVSPMPVKNLTLAMALLSSY